MLPSLNKVFVVVVVTTHKRDYCLIYGEVKKVINLNLTVSCDTWDFLSIRKLQCIVFQDLRLIFVVVCTTPEANQ